MAADSEVEEQWYTTPQVASKFDVTTETIRNWIDRGWIKAVKDKNSRWMISHTELVRRAREMYGSGEPELVEPPIDLPG